MDGECVCVCIIYKSKHDVVMNVMGGILNAGVKKCVMDEEI